jgi:hypothetical protein
LPVDTDDTELGTVAGKHPAEEIQRSFGWNGEDPLARQMLFDPSVPCDISDFAEATPINGERRQAEMSPMMRERVEEGVCGDVVGLRWSADDRAHRGEKHEEIKGHALGCAVEVPRPGNLWLHDAPEPGCVELGEETIIQDHRSVDDSSKR